LVNFGSMKVIPFNVPKSPHESFRVQVDDVPFFYNNLHQHPEIQITSILESTGIVVAGSYVGRFQPGDVFVIGSGQAHVFRNDPVYFSEKLRAHAVSLFFDQHTMGDAFWGIEEIRHFREFFSTSVGGFKVTGDAAIQISKALQKLTESRFIDRIIDFLQIIKMLHRRNDMEPLTPPAEIKKNHHQPGNRMKEIMDFTLREHHRTITLKEVADVAHLTPEAFCKYFKTHTSKTYVAFLNEIRVNNACRFLLEENDSIAVVSSKTGFSNLANFNRVFKKFTGMTPREYRKI
jgi:AraC-like DNA-binding protein